MCIYTHIYRYTQQSIVLWENDKSPVDKTFQMSAILIDDIRIVCVWCGAAVV